MIVAFFIRLTIGQLGLKIWMDTKLLVIRNSIAYFSNKLSNLKGLTEKSKPPAVIIAWHKLIDFQPWVLRLGSYDLLLSISIAMVQ